MINKIVFNSGKYIESKDIDFFILCLKEFDKDQVQALLDASPEEVILSIIHLAKLLESINEGSMKLIYDSLECLLFSEDKNDGREDSREDGGDSKEGGREKYKGL